MLEKISGCFCTQQVTYGPLCPRVIASDTPSVCLGHMWQKYDTAHRFEASQRRHKRRLYQDTEIPAQKPGGLDKHRVCWTTITAAHWHRGIQCQLERTFALDDVCQSFQGVTMVPPETLGPRHSDNGPKPLKILNSGLTMAIFHGFHAH